MRLLPSGTSARLRENLDPETWGSPCAVVYGGRDARFRRRSRTAGRVWHGSTTAANAAGYEDHLRLATLPALRELDGHRGAYVLRRDVEDGVDFIVLTLWQTLEAVRAFAGDDYELAVVPPEARALLSRADERALHYEVPFAGG